MLFSQVCAGSYTRLFSGQGVTLGLQHDISFPLFVFFISSMVLVFFFLIHGKGKTHLFPLFVNTQGIGRAVLWLYSLSTWVQVEYHLEVGQESRLFQELRAQFPVSSVWYIFLWCGSLDQYKRYSLIDAHSISPILTCTRSSLLLSSSSKALLVRAKPHRNILPKLMLVQCLWVSMFKWIWKD